MEKEPVYHMDIFDGFSPHQVENPSHRIPFSSGTKTPEAKSKVCPLILVPNFDFLIRQTESDSTSELPK